VVWDDLKKLSLKTTQIESKVKKHIGDIFLGETDAPKIDDLKIESRGGKQRGPDSVERSSDVLATGPVVEELSRRLDEADAKVGVRSFKVE